MWYIENQGGESKNEGLEGEVIHFWPLGSQD